MLRGRPAIGHDPYSADVDPERFEPGTVVLADEQFAEDEELWR